MLNSVLEEAISSGKFEMLSDSLKQKLSLLKDYSKSRNEISKIDDDIIFNSNGINAEFMLILNAYKDNLENYYVQPPTAMHPDFIKNDEDFISYIKSSKTYEKLNQLYYFSMIDEVWIKYALLRDCIQKDGMNLQPG